MNTGRLVGYVTDYFIKSYPSLANKVPMLSTLSGFLTEENALPEQFDDIPPAPSESTVSFSKQTSDKTASQQPESDMEVKLAIIKQMEDAFPEDQLQQVFDIIKVMAEQPEQVSVVHALFYKSKTK